MSCNEGRTLPSTNHRRHLSVSHQTLNYARWLMLSCTSHRSFAWYPASLVWFVYLLIKSSTSYLLDHFLLLGEKHCSILVRTTLGASAEMIPTGWQSCRCWESVIGRCGDVSWSILCERRTSPSCECTRVAACCNSTGEAFCLWCNSDSMPAKETDDGWRWRDQ